MMVKLTFVEHDGTSHAIDAQEGLSLMRAALDHGIPGIMADCGGLCTCATCHCYLDERTFAVVGPIGDDEQDILEGAIDVRDNSRLSCQIIVTPALEGTTIEIPAAQL